MSFRREQTSPQSGSNGSIDPLLPVTAQARSAGHSRSIPRVSVHRSARRRRRLRPARERYGSLGRYRSDRIVKGPLRRSAWSTNTRPCVVTTAECAIQSNPVALSVGRTPTTRKSGSTDRAGAVLRAKAIVPESPLNGFKPTRQLIGTLIGCRTARISLQIKIVRIPPHPPLRCLPASQQISKSFTL
jgi:hypothetical protein